MSHESTAAGITHIEDIANDDYRDLATDLIASVIVADIYRAALCTVQILLLNFIGTRWKAVPAQ